MNTADYVDQLIAELKNNGMVLSDVAWEAAVACVDWAYVFGARGQYCTPANRRAKYRDDHPTIKTKCKNYDGTGSCSGCKWYPDNKRTRFFDCRGFTYWILKAVYDGWELMGAGATSQWNNADNWKAKGEIATMPKDTLCCLFVKKDSKMEHTGFGLNDETVECSNGVQYFKSRNKKWTHWAVPKVVQEGEIPEPTPTPTPTPSTDKPTLRKGDRGEYVTLMQTELIQKGYSCGDSSADGVFGTQTEKAVKRFQKDNGLVEDGICGKNTWNALSEQTVLYTVTIPHLPKYHADALVTNYSGAYMTEEKG